MSMREQEAPEFSSSLRGYDRVQVDEYLAELRESVIQVDDRAVAAESALVECRRELTSPGSAGISERLAAILQLANEEADQIRAQARAEGAATTREVASAAERTLGDANQQRDAIQGEIDELATVREILLQRLVELGKQNRDDSEQYLGYVPALGARPHAEVELFDAEAIEVDAEIDDAEPVADAAVQPDLLTSTGQTPDRS